MALKNESDEFALFDVRTCVRVCMRVWVSPFVCDRMCVGRVVVLFARACVCVCLCLWLLFEWGNACVRAVAVCVCVCVCVLRAFLSAVAFFLHACVCVSLTYHTHTPRVCVFFCRCLVFCCVCAFVRTVDFLLCVCVPLICFCACVCEVVLFSLCACASVCLPLFFICLLCACVPLTFFYVRVCLRACVRAVPLPYLFELRVYKTAVAFLLRVCVRSCVPLPSCCVCACCWIVFACRWFSLRAWARVSAVFVVGGACVLACRYPFYVRACVRGIALFIACVRACVLVAFFFFLRVYVSGACRCLLFCVCAIASFFWVRAYVCVCFRFWRACVRVCVPLPFFVCLSECGCFFFFFASVRVYAPPNSWAITMPAAHMSRHGVCTGSPSHCSGAIAT